MKSSFVKTRRIIKDAIYQHNYGVKSKLMEAVNVNWNCLIGNNPVLVQHDSNIFAKEIVLTWTIFSVDEIMELSNILLRLKYLYVFICYTPHDSLQYRYH